jgi:thioredoxin reductase (NADPH)
MPGADAAAGAAGAADALGSTVATEPIACDALVIGAGPVGLFQVFQLGLQGIAAEVVDALPAPGGQCSELYPDKPIYDIPAVQVCTGRELVDRLLQQIRPFAPRFHLGQAVSSLQPRADGRFDLATSTGQQFIARSVFVAAGVGAFQPRRLQAEGADALAADQLLYRLPADGALPGRQVLVAGGEDGAVQAAVDLADAHTTAAAPASITLVHRRATLAAEAGLLHRLQAHLDAGRVRFQVGQILSVQTVPGQPARLAAVQLVDGDGQTLALPTDALLVQLGISPKLGPITQWGLALERRQLVVDPASFETSMPGIYAVGDVVSYPGKKKLILCGFHEATLAAFAAVARLRPDAPVLLQYTTTSPRLHQRLGVATVPKPGG